MSRITPAQRVRNMISGLEELIEEFSGIEYAGLRANIHQSIKALWKVWKNLVG